MRTNNPQRIAVKIIKWGLFAVVTILLIVMLTRTAGAESSADIADIQANITSAADKDKMKEGDNRMLRRLYGIDPEQLESMLLYYPASNMGAEELLFIRLKDKGNADEVKALIEQRNASQLQAFEGYGVEQTQMLKEAVINEYGRDLLYVVGEQSAAVLSAYK